MENIHFTTSTDSYKVEILKITHYVFLQESQLGSLCSLQLIDVFKKEEDNFMVSI